MSEEADDPGKFKCPRCLRDPQPKDFGSPRSCAFNADGSFTSDNWNCGTMELLRMRAYVSHENENGARIHTCDESVSVAGFWMRESHGVTHAVLLHYKDRGCTVSAYAADANNRLVPLTFAVADAMAAEVERDGP